MRICSRWKVFLRAPVLQGSLPLFLAPQPAERKTALRVFGSRRKPLALGPALDGVEDGAEVRFGDGVGVERAARRNHDRPRCCLAQRIENLLGAVVRSAVDHGAEVVERPHKSPDEPSRRPRQ